MSESEVVSEFQEILNNIDGYDRFELISQLHKFSLNVGDLEETEQMRKILKKTILKELIKGNLPNKESYQSMLRATADQIYYGSLEKGYACCLIGCRFVADRHLK